MHVKKNNDEIKAREDSLVKLAAAAVQLAAVATKCCVNDCEGDTTALARAVAELNISVDDTLEAMHIPYSAISDIEMERAAHQGAEK